MASTTQKPISPELLINRVATMYKKGGFFEKYSKDLVITVFVILAVLTAMTYFIVDANMINIKKSWTSYRCKPFILPLAGIINAPQDMDKSEYTSQNFNFCASAMFQFVFDNAISVFYYMVATVTNIFKQCLEAIEQIRRLYVRLKEQFLTFVIETVRSILNFIVPFINLLVKLRDMMRKMEGVFLSIIYMLGGVYLIWYNFDTMYYYYCSVIGNFNYYVGTGGSILGGSFSSAVSSPDSCRRNYIYSNYSYYCYFIYNCCSILRNGISNE